MQNVIGRHQFRLTAIHIALLVGSVSPTSARSDFPVRLISEDPLSSGNELASRFQSDRGITGHPLVIFADDFESGDLGSKWDQTSNRGNALSLANQSLSKEEQDWAMRLGFHFRSRPSVPLFCRNWECVQQPVESGGPIRCG